MSEPFSIFSGGFIMSKTLSAIAGFIGGITLSFFWKSRKLREYSVFVGGAIIGSISVTAAIVLTGMVASYIGLNPTNADVALGLGYLIGMVSVGVVSFVANYFSRHENDDIVQVVHELKKRRGN